MVLKNYLEINILKNILETLIIEYTFYIFSDFQ